MKRSLLMITSSLLLLLATSAVLAKNRDYTERLAQVSQFAGEPVPYVRFGLPRTTYGWEVLGENAVLVWHTRSKAYLVDLEKSDSCRRLDREISVRLSGINDLDASNGYIDIKGGGWCKMIKIRPVDVVALKQAEKLKRAANKS